MNTFIENQSWRYATKKYEAGHKVSAEDLETIKKAIQYSPSSMGIQPYKVIVVEDKSIREKLAEVSYSNKDSILNASQLFVFANIVDFGKAEVSDYISNISKTRGIPIENLEGFKSMIEGSVLAKPLQQRNEWTARQTYIALGNLLSAAAELKIDATPMEGFMVDKYNEILGLERQGLNASVIAVIGYRHNEDSAQHFVKVRKPDNELFINL